MTASSPKAASPAPHSPARGSANNSTQMGGVFGKCTEPIPTNVASIRSQQTAAMRTKSNVEMSSPGGSNSYADTKTFSQNKTVSKPHCNTLLKKKAGSVPKPEVNIFSPPEEKAHVVRTTQQHTDPFSENRVRDAGKLRKVLIPESSTKAPKAMSVRVNAATKAKWESPYACDDDGPSNGSPGASPLSGSMSPTRGSYNASPVKVGKRCPTKMDSDIFKDVTSEPSPTRAPNSNSRYNLSQQGHTTMHNERTEAELTKERNNHKRTVKPAAQTMEGVFTVVEQKNRHPNYKFAAPFARQGSIAASARIGGRRHKVESEAVRGGEVVTPFATGAASNSPAPAEFNGAKPRKVFNEKRSSQTPFARHGSVPPSQRAHYARRVYAQKATSPFAVDE